MATIATYGPDSSTATKLVVAIHRRRGADAAAMRTWTTEDGDIRHDSTIADEVAAFVRQHHARETVAPDRIIGCPHQEGIDYPMGRSCPRCPFWAGIDRFTLEPLITPAPTMSPAEILGALSSSFDAPEPPFEALTSADGHRSVLVEPLLAALERGLANPSPEPEDAATLFCYSLYLLAKWRETRAYPYVVRWLSLPDEAAFDIAGDVAVQDGADILAAVCDGDLEPIKALAVDRHANEYCRGAGVTALARLAVWAEVPRETVVSLVLWLAQEGLEREPSQVWSSLAYDSADIEALEVFPELRRAYADDLIDVRYIPPAVLDAIEAAPRGSQLEEARNEYFPIDDVAEAIGWWPQFDAEEWDGEEEPQDAEAIEPYRAPPKVGRNQPCPCGSGKKFKKCCGS